jgi:hypothetical protein
MLEKQNCVLSQKKKERRSKIISYQFSMNSFTISVGLKPLKKTKGQPVAYGLEAIMVGNLEFSGHYNLRLQTCSSAISWFQF